MVNYCKIGFFQSSQYISYKVRSKTVQLFSQLHMSCETRYTTQKGGTRCTKYFFYLYLFSYIALCQPHRMLFFIFLHKMDLRLNHCCSSMILTKLNVIKRLKCCAIVHSVICTQQKSFYTMLQKAVCYLNCSTYPYSFSLSFLKLNTLDILFGMSK